MQNGTMAYVVVSRSNPALEYGAFASQDLALRSIRLSCHALPTERRIQEEESMEVVHRRTETRVYASVEHI